jgi:drug/metabolite transporter (DMT)-like permease
MLAAVLTTIFFSLSAIFAARSVRAVGATQANLGRLAFAALALGFVAHGWGGGLGGAGREWLFWSGVVGMGLGDLAVFAALPRLGTRLTVLMTQCLAAPLAGVAEYFWLGTTLSIAQVAWGSVILIGVGVALRPGPEESAGAVKVGWLGLLYGLGAAAGQGFGAVLSRKAREVAEQAGEVTDGYTAAYQRILGGLVITLAFFAVRALWRRWVRGGGLGAEMARRPRPRDYLWIPANALCGAVIGVSCYQWALFTTPSGLVLPIVATTPLVIVPLSYWIEGERPTRRSLLGGLVAVDGAVALTIVR